MRRTIPVVSLALVAAAPSDPRGWSQGTVAAGTAGALGPVEPVAVTLPSEIAQRLREDTALFYFSPTCPHCKQVMPEINALVPRSGLHWLGIAVGSATDEELAAFRKEFAPAFEVWVDRDRAFGAATGARSTPTLYVARPAADSKTAEIVMAFAPFTRGMGTVLLLRRHPEDPFRDFVGYQSDHVCGACHGQEAASLTLTHHATAYRTLYLRDRAQDLQCVGCHVTGWGEPGGFTAGDHASPLATVGCEACHGPSGPHDGERADPRAACVRCHDAEHSVAFSVDKGVPHIDHFLAAGLTEDEWRARWQAVADGVAPRPLLAFPTGPTAGADSCRTCHPPQHKNWRKGPHARAMNRLAGPETTNVQCVTCHATPTALGPTGKAPDAIDGFRTDEGAGCETCHGPATEHVRAPRADNVVGLGESCPECVIEAICTSCHTPRWDPNWDLEKRLDEVRH